MSLFEQGRKILLFVVSRMAVLYLLMAALVMHVTSQEKIILKILDGIHDIPIYILDFAAGREVFDKSKFRFGVRYYQYYMALFPPAEGLAKEAMGYCYYQLGQMDKAVGYYREAVKLNPGLFGVYHNLGVIYERLGRHEESREAFKKAVTVPFEQAILLSNVMGPYDDIPEGTQLLGQNTESVYKLRKGYARCFQYLIKDFARTEDYKGMMDAALLGMRVTPDETEPFYYYAGYALYQLEDYESAASFFKKVVENYPRNDQAYDYLAQCYEHLKLQPLADYMRQQAENVRRRGLAERFKDPPLPAQVYYYPPVYYIQVDGRPMLRI